MRGCDGFGLRMWGVSFPERGRGVTPKGDETDDLLPMNPEGVEVDVSQGGYMSIKVYKKMCPLNPESLSPS